jgi:divalent metal cation (Fe/Co/Zn/Cd) transporter
VYAALAAQAEPAAAGERPRSLSRFDGLYFWGRIIGILVLAMIGVLCLADGIEELNLVIAGAGIGFEMASLALASSLQLPGGSAVRSIRECADAMPGVTQVERVLTMRLGRERMLVALGLRFEPAMSRREVMVTAERLKRAIRRAHPYVERVFMAVHGER